MCGRYSLALRPSQVRRMLEDEDMPVYEAPADDDNHGPRQSHNFAPGYHGVVYRADVPDHGAGPRQHKKHEVEGREEVEAPAEEVQEVRYKLQSMKWGLIPFWTKRNPDYGSMMKTINARDDSLMRDGGMWNTMKQKKRCIIIAEGFYEWLKKGKEKMPHYTKRADGKLMCLAGLWDCVQYEGSDEKLYTYTIITTDSNKHLKFLHDRMPCILENGSDEVRTWLDPNRHSWSKELQSLLRPYEGELITYPVDKAVGKVGNDSPNFIIPIDSTENKSNIANFFAKGATNSAAVKPGKESKPRVKEGTNSTSDEQDSSQVGKEEDTYQTEEDSSSDAIKHEPGEDRKTVEHEGSENNAPLPVPKSEGNTGIKREHEKEDAEEAPNKAAKTENHGDTVRVTRSATTNKQSSPAKKSVAPTEKGTQRITSFFKK